MRVVALEPARRAPARPHSPDAAPCAWKPGSSPNERDILSTFTHDSESDTTHEAGKTVVADADVLATPHESPSFAELGVRPEIVAALQKLGIERTFAIQELTLPLAMAGDDLIGQARTGMGKTFGFGVPLLHRISTGDDLDGTPRALVVVPTRELCLQVTKDLTGISQEVPVGSADEPRMLRVQAIYGGRPYEEQISALNEGVDVIVGTPGRLLDLCSQKHLKLDRVSVAVLDEADEMLDLGFLPDIEKLLSRVPENRQTMLFSATMPGPIITLARTFLRRPTHVRAEEHDSPAVHARTAQFVYRAHALDKLELVSRVLQARDRGATMIFTRTKRQADQLSKDLEERGFSVRPIHGDLGQIAREKALKAFRTGKVDILVATDVAARGIDIDDVTHVINLHCPDDENTFVHRVGRTGRAGRTGIAITLVDWEDTARWKAINASLSLDKPDPVETYSTSEHLYSDLDIPKEVTGRVSIPARSSTDGPAEQSSKPEASRPPRKNDDNRQRRRTRGGQRTGNKQSASSGEPAGAGSSGSTPGGSGPGKGGSAGSGGDDAGAGEKGSGGPRRRRRRRKPAGDAQSVAPTGTGSATGPGTASS
ncbi:DEAD/DEAH box helicase [Lolliginicoccus levis]|uniref:DEAD/DEAH box helicase n=1 Tax=Lolliginicoccus levis TaxID=2919542 RepID=UPI00241DFFF2|nr:DEAD/DEAH box helicase [Lolliginicoccus levis]